MATIKIDRLTGDNYDTWKIHMRAILIKNDLWDFVSGSSPKPPISDSKYAEWSKLDKKAEADILLAVSPSELAALDGLESSKAIWDKLKSMYQSSGPARKASLLKRLVLTRMQEDDDLKKHIADFFDAVKKLKEIGLIVIDELLAILLLYSLPDSFAMFRTAMESRDDLPSTETLKVKIIEDYEARKSKTTTDEGAMFVKRINKNYRRFNVKNNEQTTHTHSQRNNIVSSVDCHRCGRRGHLAKDCRTKTKFIKHRQSAQNIENRGEDRESTTLLTEEALLGRKNNAIWCIDSGCTAHMCNERTFIQDFTEVNSELNLANSERTQITGTGKVKLSVDTGSEERKINIEKVFYVPDLRTNLMSVAIMTDHGFEVRFRKNDAIVVDENNKIHMRADRIGNLYHVRMSDNYVCNIETVNNSMDMWHQRLGHLNERDLKSMVNNGLVHGITFKDGEKLSQCEVCISEKQTCTPFPKKRESSTTELLEIVHSDVCGPMNHKSYSGKRYFVTFIDDKSRWCEVYFIANKSDVFSVFKIYKAYAENLTGKKIKNLQSDNGKEYVNNEFNDYLQNAGIRRRLTAPYTPQQNGVAERKNRTLVEMARCMMRQAESPPTFWAEAINTANYIRNRCPTTALNGEIPFTLWKGKKPTVIYMHVFGSKVYYKEKGKPKGKFDSRSKLGIFVGYDIQSKAYRIHDPTTKKIIITRDVKFMNETAFRHEYKEILDEEEGIDEEEVQIELNTNNKRKETFENRKNDATPGSSYDKSDESEEDDDKSPPRSVKSTISWEHLIEPKRGRGRPRMIRTGQAGRPRKEYHTVEETDKESDEWLSAGIATVEQVTWKDIQKGSDVHLYYEFFTH